MKIFDKFLRNGTARRRAHSASKVMQIFHIRHFSVIRISLFRKKRFGIFPYPKLSR